MLQASFTFSCINLLFVATNDELFFCPYLLKSKSDHVEKSIERKFFTALILWLNFFLLSLSEDRAVPMWDKIMWKRAKKVFYELMKEKNICRDVSARNVSVFKVNVSFTLPFCFGVNFGCDVAIKRQEEVELLLHFIDSFFRKSFKYSNFRYE